MTTNYIEFYYEHIHNLDDDDCTNNIFDIRKYMNHLDIIFYNFKYKVDHIAEYNVQDVLDDYMYVEKYLHYYELHDDIINKESDTVKTCLIIYFTTRIKELEQLRGSIIC